MTHRVTPCTYDTDCFYAVVVKEMRKSSVECEALKKIRCVQTIYTVSHVKFPPPLALPASRYSGEPAMSQRLILTS